MPRKTLALISGLVLVTIILFVIALKSSKTVTTPLPPQEQQYDAMKQVEVSPPVPVHSILSISPNPVVVAPGQQGSVEVLIDTSDNEVTAIQLEIAYDPNVISNVKLTPGALFPSPVLLFDKNRVLEGRYTYAYGIMPNQTTIQGAGSVAKITFTAKNKPGTDSQLALLPESLVTARGISNSVLKSATGTVVRIGQ